MGVAMHQHLCRLLHSACLCNCHPLYTYRRYSHSGYLFQCVAAKTIIIAIHCTIGVHTPFWLSFISVLFEAHLWASCLKLSWLPKKSRCTKLLLTVCMWPVTVAKVSKTYKTTNTRYMQKIAIQPTGGGLAHACPTHCWGILGSWSHFSAHLESIVCQSVVPHFSDTSYTQN